ncbi:protein AMEIOTIC 1 homolog isoform X1 [Cryptomeria japonica]|uniref:protein AMEIOTIC 1 homolog isoform X1 n=1 Tax=Cryptomeria japonica TaxID=3369 RepID=UPI0025ACB641|nr:protein AMEIOTIC 1 homolog isoform X1 [Cryptomeria japonica]XP_057843042.1 protein AMEIOTIC 1 homolog isoform X1 [Cryptomeria japonica]
MADAEVINGFRLNTGEVVRVGDFVYLFPADANVELYIARIDKLYHDEEGKRLIQIRWYYRPKDLQHEPPSNPLNNEVYYTNYFDCQLVESVAKICKVFTRSEYFKLNEEQKSYDRPVSEEDIFFFEYVYSAETGSFMKMSGSGEADRRRSFGKQNSPDPSLKILIKALLDVEETIPKDAKPACWADERLTWIAKVNESKTVQNITERLLHLADCSQLIREKDGKNEYKYLSAWKSAVTADSSPESLLQNIEHLQNFVQQRNGRAEKKRKRYGSEQGKKKDKLPLLQDVCEELDEKKGARIKEGSTYEINRTCLPPKAPIHLKYIRTVLVAEKTDTHVRVKFPSILALRNLFGTDKNVEQTMQHPSLDEQFVMGQKLAERVLWRQISSGEYNTQGHLESFWLISGDPADEKLQMIQPAHLTDGTEDVKLTNDECKELIKFEGTPDVKFPSDVEGDGNKLPVKWGLRRKVAINRKHRSMEKGNEQTSTGGDSLETTTKVPRKQRRYTVNEDDPTPGEISSMLRLPKEMQGRWTGERYRAAQLKLVAIMREKAAVPGKPILRPALREEARKHIGDTGLLDHLLKHMTDTVIKNGERFRRRHNAEGAMEYWLEPASLMEIRKQAGIQDPWWIPPPGWQPGDKVSLYGCVSGMTPSEAEEMKTLREELNNVKRELLSCKNMNVNEEKKMIQEEDHDILKETLQQAEAETSQIDCQDEMMTPLGTTDHKHILEASVSLHKWSRCNIVERVEKLQTETNKKIQEMESNHRAEKKHLEYQIAKVTETLERMQEEMTNLIKSVENSKVAPMKEPSSEKKAQTGFRICKQEGTFLWPSMTPKSSNRVPLKYIFSPRQLQVTPPSAVYNLPSEHSLQKTVNIDVKDTTVSAGITSTVVVCKSSSKGGLQNGQKDPAQDTCGNQVSLSPKSHSEVEAEAEAKASPHPAMQKELLSMYLTTPEKQWAQNQMILSRSPVPNFMSDQIVWPVPSQPVTTHAQDSGGGGGGFHVDLPESSRTAPCQSTWLGLAPPAASSAAHNA